jgi:UDP-N-acetylmuramoyl-L-alanyl-D-glutamate--2,6-diaminopimelate ligase
MKLTTILSAYPLLQINGTLPATIKGFSADSKNIQPGYLYICIRGEKEDGHRFAGEAINNGALMIVSEQSLKMPVPVAVVADTRHFLSYVADRYYGQPSKRMEVTGITGTNGKTTTVHYLYQIYQSAGLQAAMMGTVGVRAGETFIRQNLTTPGAEELHKTLWQLAESGVEYVAMEVSSHALVQKRVEHCRFTTAVFTNISREHLDYHQTMEQYFQAKAHLFDLTGKTKVSKSIINIDDGRAKDLAQNTPGSVWTYGIDQPADVRVLAITPLADGGSLINTQTPLGAYKFIVRLHGRYNIYNALAAATTALAQGIEPAAVMAGIESLLQVPGRLELLPSPAGVRVYLDYAHTPDGLEKVLQAVSEYIHRRIILVFGCRGSRDTGKRPQMGQIAERYADEIILTSDNPAGEDPNAIIADISKDMIKKPAFVPDREMAVQYALELAREGDIVLITGKGREEYQLVGKTSIPYSDHHAVASYLGHKHVNN